jgi:hypothetical protein
MKNFVSSARGKVAAGILAVVVLGGATVGVASAANAHARKGSSVVKTATHTPKPAVTHTPKPSKTPRPVLLKFVENQNVAISGTKTVGSTLTATPGIYVPAADTVTYQWQRNGVNIAGATSTTYVLTADDLGKKIRVIETVVKAGYKTKVEASNRLWIPAA